MRYFGSAAFLAFALMVSVASAGSNSHLGARDLHRLVVGKTIHLKLAFGVELPISYRGNGTMVGRIRAAAAVLSGTGAKSDVGRWWIASDQLCQAWSRWLGGATYCYRLSRNGNNVRWRRNDGRSGTARIGG